MGVSSWPVKGRFMIQQMGTIELKRWRKSERKISTNNGPGVKHKDIENISSFFSSAGLEAYKDKLQRSVQGITV